MKRGAKPDVFVDLCVQRDYLARNGARRCLNADLVAANLRHLIAYARWAKVPVLSCVDRRRVNDLSGETPCPYSPRSPEQDKEPFSLLPNRTVIESDNCLCVSLDVLRRHQQVILTKYHRDPFTNPKFDRLVTEMPARRFILFGVPLESSLRLLALGLLLRQRRVSVLHDACGFWDADRANMALRQLAVKGCDLRRTEDFIRAALARRGSYYRGRNGNGRSVA